MKMDPTKEFFEFSENLDETKELTLGNYQLRGKLGSGGMGEVYKAMDLRYERECALKIMHPSQGKQSLQRFIKEAQAIGKLTHPNIVTMYEIVTFPQHCLVMEYVKGITLTQFLQKQSTLAEKLEIFAKVCNAIEYAHSKNIIHRDLKPDNIMIDQYNEPRVMDFGIAKHLDTGQTLTKTGEIVGTPKYMAPEVANGKKATKKSDIFSLGVILYLMLAKKLPFEGENVMEIFYQIFDYDPIPPSKISPKISKDLDLICLKALDKFPKNRFSISFLKKEIESVLNNKPIQSRPPNAVIKTQKWLQRNPKKSLVALTVFFIIAMFILNQEYRHELLVKEKKQLEQKNEQVKKKYKEAQEKYKEAQEKYREAQEKYKKAGLRNQSSYLKEIENEIKQRNHLKAHQLMQEAKKSQKELEKLIKAKLSKKYSEHLHFISKYSIEPHLSKKQREIFFTADSNCVISPWGKYIAFSKNKKTYICELEQLTKNHIAHVALENNGVVYKNGEQKVNIANKFSTLDSYGLLHFSPSEHLLAIASLKELVIYDLQKYQIIRRSKTKGITKLVFARNSKLLAMSFHPLEQKTRVDLGVLNIENGDFIIAAKNLETLNPRMDFNIDSSVLIAAKTNKIWFWDFQKRVKKNQKKSDHKFAGNSCKVVKFTNSEYLFWGDETGYIHRHSIAGRDWVKFSEQMKGKVFGLSAHKGAVTHIEFSKDYRFWVTAGADQKIYIWDFMRLRKFSTIKQSNKILQVGFSADGRYLNVLLEKQNGVLYQKWLFEPFFKKKLEIPSAFQKILKKIKKTHFTRLDFFSTSPLSISPKKNFLAISYLTYIFIWDLKNTRFFKLLPESFFHSQAVDLCFSSDESWLAALFRSNSVVVKNIYNPKKKFVLNNTADTRNIVFDRSDCFMICNDKENIRIWDIKAESTVYFDRMKTKTRSMAISPDNRWLALGQAKDHLEVWEMDWESLKVVSKWHYKSENDCLIKAVIFVNDKKLISGNELGFVNVFERKENAWERISSERPERNFKLPIDRLSIAPDKNHLAIFSKNHILISHLQNNSLYTYLYPGYFKGFSANFSLDWQYLAFPSSNGNVLLFDWKLGKR